MTKNACREIIQLLMQVPKPTIRDVNLAKMQVAQALNLQTLTPNSMLIRNLKPDEKASPRALRTLFAFFSSISSRKHISPSFL
jgi:hypothetical protein